MGSKVTKNESYTVQIKDQTFELTRAEAEELHNKLQGALGISPFKWEIPREKEQNIQLPRPIPLPRTGPSQPWPRQWPDEGIYKGPTCGVTGEPL